MKLSPEDVFRRVYTDNFTAILKYFLRRVGEPEDAADLVAETFLVAWRRTAEMPPGDESRLWLYGVARRVLATHGRGARRREQLSQRLGLELRRNHVVEDPAADLVETAAVLDALSALEPSDREVLELTLWEDLAPREIAVALGLPAQLVRTRLSRARKRIRALLESGSPPPKDARGQGKWLPGRHDPQRTGHEQFVRSQPVPKEAR